MARYDWRLYMSEFLGLPEFTEFRSMAPPILVRDDVKFTMYDADRNPIISYITNNSIAESE